MAEIIRSVKGTRDFYPEQMTVRRWMFDKIRTVSTLFGYQEYEGPCLEFIDLYAAKSGEELVKEQAFVFSTPGDDLLTLRPELTPTLARMVAQQQYELTFPLRWWSIGPFWRYEQPQRGRTREFYQWNIDLIGTESVAADVEIVAVAAMFMQEVGLSADQVRITVNNRRLMDQVFSRLSINRELRSSVFRLVDKLEKLSKQAWSNQAIETGLSYDQVDGLLKQLENESLWYDSPELIEFFELINTFGVQDYVVFDPKLVRGLDYYTGTVFEAFEIGGQSRAILGGGRYDNLVADVGGKPLPGVGFAMGDVVIELVLHDAGVIPDGLGDTVQILVTVFDSETVPESLRLATEIRQAGYRVVVYPDADKLGKQFKFADKRDIPIAVILGPDEINAGMVAIKNLKTREQVTVAREILLEQIEKFLPCHS
ncbi:MAG TPA: histidine--tRNA ligase [Brevefilum fermentans]|jgi:histidyl-tRNA synthetase|uniref:Histidine--tRNA ligase n=1 Tax=Candidatus Brevifilum fermentans TaxID=1986204 RepID=A0A1Y6K5Y2_9CHLR|nr:histidine--tRNA ligase [Brevefilum fermentans]MDI9566969.1 histidine--tRNA ligase [Chloroflexota bacterium]SMX54288.1 Histidine--tRNA ligase [Brevefilum fermentans]HQA29144.1 histidine--tRNA ligase [Brevefilum fermentans]